LRLALILFLVAGTAHAQAACPFWAPWNRALVPTYLGLQTYDAWRTDHNLSGIGREDNPLARPFVGTRAGRVAYFSINAGLIVGGAWFAHRTGHRKIEKVILFFGIAEETQADIHSATATYVVPPLGKGAVGR
jgi:hypothetical protein